MSYDYMAYSQGSDVTLTQRDLNNLHHINATSSISVTLPTCVEGSWVFIQNTHSTNAITIKQPDTTTICTLYDGEGAMFIAQRDSTGFVWPSGVTIQSTGGQATVRTDFTIDDSDTGLVLKSPDGHYWRISVDNAGTLSTADLGNDRASFSGVLP